MHGNSNQRGSAGTDLLKIAVLMGGRSPEHEISMESGRAVFKALDGSLFQGRAVVIDPDGLWHLFPEGVEPQAGEDAVSDAGSARSAALAPDKAVQFLREWGIDAAFLALHGPNGEDGTIQGFFHTVSIPFTASAVHGSVVGMDKRITKLIAARHGIDTPAWRDISLRDWTSRRDEMVDRLKQDPGLPCFVKAMRSGSSVGVYRVLEGDELSQSLDGAFEIDTHVLVEREVKGRELTCVVLGNAGDGLEALPVVEIVPLRGADFFDYQAKYEPGGAEEICPADIDSAAARKIQELAMAVHEQCRFRGFSRTDFIMNEEGTWLLESNTIPGLTPASILPKAAKAAGMSLTVLVTNIIGQALGLRRIGEGKRSKRRS